MVGSGVGGGFQMLQPSWNKRRNKKRERNGEKRKEDPVLDVTEQLAPGLRTLLTACLSFSHEFTE